MNTVGMIGLGLLGSAIAERLLLAGYSVPEEPAAPEAPVPAEEPPAAPAAPAPAPSDS